jgi:hypothetical protein
VSTYRYQSYLGASRRAWLHGIGWVSPGAVLSLSDDQAATVTLGRGESLVRLDPPDSSAAVVASEPEPAVEAPASPLPVEPVQAEPAPSDTPPEPPAESPADVDPPKRTRRRRR